MNNCYTVSKIKISKGELRIKKKIIAITTLIIVIIIISIIIVINCNGRENSIKQALYTGRYKDFRIIHEEPTNKGSIVFCINTDNTNQSLSTAFVSKNIFGYKHLYSGVSAIDGLGERDLTARYFPAIEKTSLPIYFGVILNDKIEKVSVKQDNNSETKNAKIIDTADCRIWLVYMAGFKGTEFEIVGYDSNGTEIYKMADTIPWSAEQKPAKIPYE